MHEWVATVVTGYVVDGRTSSIRRLSPPRPDCRLRLICFPYAGAGAYVYRAWVRHLPDDIELAAVQLPGREDRIREAPLRDLPSVLEMLSADLAGSFDRPVVFFGHSLGAILSAEVARRMHESGAGTPARLFVSGCPALPVVHVGRQPIHQLDDSRLTNHIRQLGGTPDEILLDEAMIALVLGLVRADYTLLHEYQYLPGHWLPCPITVFGGEDDPTTTRASLEAWSSIAPGEAVLHVLPGGHFFIHSVREQLLRLLVADLPSASQRGDG